MSRCTTLLEIKMKALLATAATVALTLTLALPASATQVTIKSAAPEKTPVETFATPFGAPCTIAQIEAGMACDADVRTKKNMYPSAPVFPQFGI
ncbi:MAG: hypothetical protein AAFP99_05500 [Pseudomonadota bacterium]